MTVYAEQLSCQELVELVTDYLEGALSEEETARFESHIGRCDGCNVYLEQVRQTIVMTGRLSEDALLAAETRGVIADAIEALPSTQRAVISLRDVEGWTSEEVRNALELSETNQRVLLHRARSKVRAALESYLQENA